MKKRIFALVCGLLVLVAFQAAAQSAGSFASGLPKIPRRVYFAPLPPAEAKANPAFAMIPDYLYTAICAVQPIVRASDSAGAQATVRVLEADSGRRLTVELLEEGKVVARRSFSGSDDFALASFVNETAAELAPRLGFVEPRVELVGGGASTLPDSALIREVQLSERLARPIEFSLTASGITRTLSGNSPSSFAVSPMPVIFNFVWYGSGTLGLVTSLWSYYGTGITFGHTEFTGGPGTTRSLFLLPGVGVEYRTLGNLFAAFSAILYGGYLHVTNTTNEPIGSSPGGSTFIPFLGPGASRSLFYPAARFSSNVGVVVAPKFMVETGFSFNLNPGEMFNPPYPAEDSFISVQYLTLGVVYRP